MIPSRGYVAVFSHLLTDREHRYPIVAWSDDGDPVIVGRKGLVTLDLLTRCGSEEWAFRGVETARQERGSIEGRPAAAPSSPTRQALPRLVHGRGARAPRSTAPRSKP